MQHERICGINAVTALFKQRPHSVQRLFYAPTMKHIAGPLCSVMALARRPYRMLEADELHNAAGTLHHGGIVAIADVRRLPVLDPGNPPLGSILLVLDQISNPHNFGAIIRSAAFFGVANVLLHESPGQAMLSDAAYRTAEGGFEYLSLFTTRRLAPALIALQAFYRTVAATLSEDALLLERLPRDRPIALVLGNEERGIATDTVAACRRKVRIAGAGRVQSLNVAQATAVLLASLAAPVGDTGRT